MIVISCGWALLIMSSINWVAVFSGIFLFFKDDCGGIYMFMILIRVLLGSNNLTTIPYSLLCDVSIYSGFRTYIAKPPRVLPARRDSTNMKPSRAGGAAPSAIHIS